MTVKKLVLAHFEDGVDRAVGDSAHDIDLIAIAHDVAKAACAPIELRGQAKIAVIRNACANQLVVAIGLDKVANTGRGGGVGRILAKEDLDAQWRDSCSRRL